MSTKLSFLSRGAAVAGILALALPAFAQTSQPTAPSTTNPPAAAATSVPKQSSGEVGHKADKKLHAEKDAKDMKAAEKKDDAHKLTAEKPVTKKLDPAVPATGAATSK